MPARLVLRWLLGCLLVSPLLATRPLDPKYSSTLLTLCDGLVATQITDRTSPDYGALVCPSTNPQAHPLHSRAAEAVYPFALAWQRTHDAKYRDAAIPLARWLIGKQQPRGAWGEAAPNFDGWTGTTADQLISLAGAYPILREELTPADRTAWENSMRRAADFIVQTFPVGNINYHPTGAVALLLTADALHDPQPAWLAKADSLVALTFKAVNADGLLTGEGSGVDLGYNLAQSIGYLALYGILKSDDAIKERAAGLLRTHALFVYPNGAVDNSWGTRSYKWTYESGTKTAPGVYFTFALLADQDPDFAPAGLRCLDYLIGHAMHDGLVTGGPHVDEHASLTPPCLYSTFARAQSLALALAYAPAETSAPAPAKTWFHFFPTINVTLVRTGHLMATVSAYGAIERYGRGQVSRGGSVTNLWMEGFGRDGFAQASSVSVYRREEDIHMPNEPELRPLTPRAECTIDGIYYTNLFETDGKMSVTEEAQAITITTTGRLRAVTGAVSEVGYRLTHRFFSDHLTKEWTFTSPSAQAIRVVEPFVSDPDLSVTLVSPQRATLQPNGSRAWTFALGRAPAGCVLSVNEDPAPYWSPFPGVNCRPLVITLTTAAGQPTLLETSFGPGPEK
ncbi:MAG: hypothetical protein JWQ83_1075 [Lacunisphaera sp.]|nr:hypothetical protein [Lacunisphaera sp.]